MKHSRKILPFLLLPAFALSACTPPPDHSEKTYPNDNDNAAVYAEKTQLSDKQVGENTVHVYGSDQTAVEGYKTVAFEENNDLLADNDGMGWVGLEDPLYGGLPFSGYMGDMPEMKCVSMTTVWSCYEEKPGEFDWTVLDEAIAYWAERGKNINMRLITDELTEMQGIKTGCPPWIYEAPFNVPKIVKDGVIYADISNEVYQERLKLFLTEFANHYTAEDYPYRDAIEVVELRGYGQWGEWHSGWNTYESLEERNAVMSRIIDEWREAWGDKLLVVSCTYEFATNMKGLTNPETYDDFMYFMGYDHALQLDNISFRRDGIAFDLREYDSRFAVDFFYLNNNLPLFGELGNGYALHGDDSPYPIFESLSESLHKWRTNYHTLVSWRQDGFQKLIDAEPVVVDYFNRLMGYRLVPDKVQYSAQVKAGDKLYLNTLWSNQAMGRAWKDYDLSVYLENAAGQTVYKGTDTRFNPVSINGGEPHFFDLMYDLPESLANGTYTLKFAVSDREGNPQIRLPIAGDDGSKKYYLGEVTVGSQAAKNLSTVDDLEGEQNFTLLGETKLTDTLSVDGSKALVGSGTGVFAQGIPKLRNGRTYYVSFDYKANKPKSEIKINDQSRYLVGAYAPQDQSWGDCYDWLDVSNTVSHRSVTLNIPDDGKEYYLAFGGKNDVAPIAVDNVSVVKADKVQANFLINPNFTEKQEDGSYKMLATYIPNWSEGLQLRERLAPHSTYMLTFDAKTVVDISGGGFFYVMLKDPDQSMDYDTNRYGSIESFSLNRIGSFWTPVDYGYKKYSYVFNTEGYGNGWQLVFGVRNKGGVAIKNISLTRLNTDASYASDPVEIEHNVVPKKNINVNAEGGLVENFEAGVIKGTCMDLGARSNGVLRTTKLHSEIDHVISGKYSAYVDNDPKQFWYTNDQQFLRTNAVKFSPNTTYRVRFKFKIIRAPESDAYFYCTARRANTSKNDAGMFKWTMDGYEVGKVYSVEYEFTTGNFDNYLFLWGVYRSGGISIDDVWFEKVEPTGATTPKVTQGHAYQITQELLYR